MPFPLELAELLGHWGSYIVYLIIGIAFGATLEVAGFGKSTKLADQFYFKDMTVLKVMFGAIVVAMILIFLASALGLLDYNLIWVNPTYLWPGIVGGLVMGVGFIVGGFCPGTSLVAAATAKIDGIFFVLGVIFGIFFFGETVENFERFWYSSDMGRYTLPEMFGISTGAMVLIIAVGALVAFFGAEKLEEIFGDADPKKAPRWRYSAAGAVVVAAIGVLLIGQPTAEDRWEQIKDDKEPLIAERSIQIHPAELLEITHDDKLNIVILDVRPEVDYNLFHIRDAEHLAPDEVTEIVPGLHLEPDNTVFVVVSNDEAAATDAWKLLVAEAIPNVYILEGGVNNWLDTFSDDEFKDEHALAKMADDEMRYGFDIAFGDRYGVAAPDPYDFVIIKIVEAVEGEGDDTEEPQATPEPIEPVEGAIIYTPKVKLELKRGPSGGGCG